MSVRGHGVGRLISLRRRGHQSWRRYRSHRFRSPVHVELVRVDSHTQVRAGASDEKGERGADLVLNTIDSLDDQPVDIASVLDGTSPNRPTRSEPKPLAARRAAWLETTDEVHR